MLRIFIFIVLIISFSSSVENNISKQTFIDKTHGYISNKVKNISSFTDDLTLGTLNFTHSLVTEQNTTFKSVDELFKNEKYIEETQKSFLRLSSDYTYLSKSDSEFNVRLNAKLALSKSNRHLKLYLSDFNKKNFSDIIQKNSDDEIKPEIGISYLQTINKIFDIKYYLGVKSLDLYTRVKISRELNTQFWKIKFLQTIEYSIEDEFSENTKLYFDNELLENILFRIEFDRGTESQNDGMDYSSNISLFMKFRKNRGVQLSQGFYGNTEYSYSNDSLNFIDKSYSGINNYVTQITFRESVWKKWFFYEISSGVNFHKQYDFSPNYKVYLKIDMFFGDI